MTVIVPDNIKDRYIGLEYFGVMQSETVPLPTVVVVINPYYSTIIELRTRAGGLKKTWYYNQDTDNPIQSVKIERTEKGFGICKITFSELMFPIDASDTVKITFGDTVIYDGIVDNDVDVSDPVMVASPFWKRFEEVTFSGTYAVGTAIKTIMEDIIGDSEAETGVSWDSNEVNVGDAPPVLTVTYTDATITEILDTLVEMAGSTYYWGVDADRVFYVRKYDDAGSIAYRFYATEEAEYEKVKITDDYSKIEMTEAVVYKKADGGGEAVKVGQVGNSGNVSYPPLDIVKKIRNKKGKLTASEYILDETALVWAYEYLKKLALDSTSATVDNIDISKYSPEIGDRILIEDEFKKSMVVAIECDVTTLWTNTSLATSGGKDDEACIKLFNDGSNDSTYDFERDVSWYKQQKVGMYIKAPAGTELEISFFPETGTPSYAVFKVAVSDSELCYKDFDVTWNFRYVKFKYVAGDIYVDNMQVFCETKRQLVTTVKKIGIKWNSTGLNCNLGCGNIKNPETTLMSKLNRKIKILEAINNI
jgi:hypothetical protein